MKNSNIKIPEKSIKQFCEKWDITELALFGSVLKKKLRKDSDIDVLVTFSKETNWTLLDHVEMQDELIEIFGRAVDIVNRKGIERSSNNIRKKSIIESSEVIYAAS